MPRIGYRAGGVANNANSNIPSWLTRVRAAQPSGGAVFQIPWPPKGQLEVGNSDPSQDQIHYAKELADDRRQVWAANDNYTSLRTILDAAYAHAATGKGKERHARDLPFDEQPMMTTARQVGVGFTLGQAIKKAGESAGMIQRGQYDAAEAECLGAINYLAGAVLWMRERKDAA